MGGSEKVGVGLTVKFARSQFKGALWRLVFENVGFYGFATKRATRRGYEALARFGKVVLAFMAVQESETDEC